MIDLRRDETGRLPIGVADVAAAYLVVTWLLAIVEIPPIPVSPTVHAPFLLLAAADPLMTAGWRRLRLQPAFWWLSGFLALRAGLEVASGPLLVENHLAAARMTAAFLGTALLGAYAAAHQQRWRRVLTTCAVTLLASLVWFLLEISIGSPFVTWRAQLYGDIYAQQGVITLDALRTGLTPFLHLLGYQVAFALPVAVVALATAASFGRRLALAVAVLVAFLALAASLQRGALLASMIALGAVVLFWSAGRRRLGAAGMVGGLLAASAVAITAARSDSIRALAEASIGAKIGSDEAGRDSDFRLRLQGRAVEVLAQHPLGLRVAGLDWGEVGFMHLHRRSGNVPSDYEAPFAPHNAYLTSGISLGSGAVIAGIVTAMILVVAAWRLVRQPPDELPEGNARAVGGALIGLLTAQALTHNAGIPTAEPTTMIACALVLAAMSYPAGRSTV